MTQHPPAPQAAEEWVCQFCFPREPYAGARGCPRCGCDTYQSPRAAYEANGGTYSANAKVTRPCPMPGPDGLACDRAPHAHPVVGGQEEHAAALPEIPGARVSWDYLAPARYTALPGVCEGLVALEDFLFALGDWHADLRRFS